MKLKDLSWDRSEADKATATVMGLTLVAYKNNGKWDARLTCLQRRPEIETGFDTIEEAMRYAEHILLGREIKRYFSFVK